MTAIDVLVSCRCHRTIEVPAKLLKKGKELHLGRFIAEKIDDEGDPGPAWTPESFCENSEIYLPEQDIEVVERAGKVVSARKLN
ncbi:MAG: hypothetical protein WC869_01200 [Phycisphaerae bacterium]|jgi:hypothetical protein